MVLTKESLVSRWLKETNGFWFVLYATTMAFGLYTCVYAIRKTFSVATFEGIYFVGISYKVWLVMFQVIGYALSKFVGIKFISELKQGSRLPASFLWRASRQSHGCYSQLFLLPTISCFFSRMDFLSVWYGE